MGSGANIVSVLKDAQPQGAAVGLVVYEGLYSITAGEETALTDVSGNAMVIDIDCEVLFGIVNSSTAPSGDGTLAINDDGTAFLTATTMAADTSYLMPLDYSARTIGAGSAITGAAVTRDLVGSLVLVVRPT